MNARRCFTVVLACVIVSLSAELLRAQEVAPTAENATTQPGRTSATVAAPVEEPVGGPATQAAPPIIALGKYTISIELPALSGRLFDRFDYSFHGQATILPQAHGDFPAAYSGPNSFRDTSEAQTSYTGTLFMGMRLLPGTEVYFNPEVSAGNGLSGVFGLGDPPNGETPRVSSAEPSPALARLFLRETFGFGGGQSDVPDGANLIAGKQDINRLTVTVGKFAANDIFDNNTYAHDPRSQFMNWGLFENGAWDYPADTKGYTQGLTLELNQKDYTLRYGIFRPPQDANGGKLDDHFNRACDQVVEFEQRYTLWGQPGVARPLAYFNESHMGDYRNAINARPVNPNVLETRSYSHPKYGFALSFEQSLCTGLAVFGRAGWNNGQSESWAFTEVDRAISLGLSLKGASWHRPDDVLGIAGIMSGLSKDHRDYLAAGGLGFQLGDGRLRYAPEEVIEAYYLLTLTKNIFFTADYQFIDHPGYNADRGPVSIGGFRAHFEF